jgi:NTP pyrophosphatase (non-canonical NTP hydrolase)
MTKLDEEFLGLVKDNAANGINAIVDFCHNESAVKGWWTAKDGSHLKDNPLTFSNKLMLIVSEIAEAMEGDRKDSMDDHLPHRKMAEVELADAVIRIFDLAGAYGYDLGGAVVEKMEYNKTRKDHSKEARGEANGKRY